MSFRWYFMFCCALLVFGMSPVSANDDRNAYTTSYTNGVSLAYETGDYAATQHAEQLWRNFMWRMDERFLDNTQYGIWLEQSEVVRQQAVIGAERMWKLHEQLLASRKSSVGYFNKRVEQYKLALSDWPKTGRAYFLSELQAVQKYRQVRGRNISEEINKVIQSDFKDYTNTLVRLLMSDQKGWDFRETEAWLARENEKRVALTLAERDHRLAKLDSNPTISAITQFVWQDFYVQGLMRETRTNVSETFRIVIERHDAAMLAHVERLYELARTS
ncbi:MAG: hypothetical protein ACRC5C_12230 [Bacilli bacterium]